MAQSNGNNAVYLDPKRPMEERVDDLVSRMTLEEKISQMKYEAEAIPRLNVPAFNWWNECLHGVGRAGQATVFPQSIGMAASFNNDLLFDVASVIGDEGRAKYHDFVQHDDRTIFKGITFWTPNINIFRDPRWGRGQETYGEDPYLTGRMGVAFVKGLQGDDPVYLKTVATPKHYAVHSGPEALRHHFDAVVDPKDLRETYLPAFRDTIKEAKAFSIMGAYNRTNGEVCCGSPTLLQEILREEWGFEGYVVSDCGAISDFHLHHTVTSTPEQSAAMGVNNGCDLNCGRVYPALKGAVEQGLISEETVTRAVKRLFTARFKLGMFDTSETDPYAKADISIVESKPHRDLAMNMARESMVLLKNEGGLLPLSKDTTTIAVIGPNADDRTVLLGNYNGFPSKYVTILEGIRNVASADTNIMYAKGCPWLNHQPDHWGKVDEHGYAEAIAAAERSDVAVVCMGISNEIEGEEGSASASEWEGDRISISLPPVQQKLLEEIAAVGKPVVLVLLNGSALEITWAQENIPAILEAWYPGGEGGQAVAEVLFGDYNPAGRLPVTFVNSLDQLPPFTDYRLETPTMGRTYRYMKEEPLYPFGYGLSYTDFEYSNLSVKNESLVAGEDQKITVDVENTGKVAGDEVVQLYLTDVEASVSVPHWRLVGFKRINLKPGEKKSVPFDLSARRMCLIDNRGEAVLEPGTFRVYAGGSQPDSRSKALTGKEPLSVTFEATGAAKEFEY